MKVFTPKSLWYIFHTLQYLIIDSGRRKKSDIQGREKIRQIRNDWLGIVAGDPFLPKMFLPKPWYGDEAEKLVKTLAKC